jgi:hypothetical protein
MLGFYLSKRRSMNQLFDPFNGKFCNMGSVLAIENNLRAVGTVTSSRVRTEIKHANNCSNGEMNPSSAS